MQGIDGRNSVGKLACVVIGYHLLAFCAIQVIGHLLHGAWFSGDSLVRWDAAHYEWIAKHGYVSFRQAFFPLFPLIWRFLSTGAEGVSLFNAVLYLTCVVMLSVTLRANVKAILIWLALPSAIFYFVPYSESVYFAGGLIIIMALRANSRNWVAAGLFVCTLSRPAFTTLLPSLLLVSLVVNVTRRDLIKDVAVYILASLVGLLLVSMLQHHYTNEWLGFYSAQSVWGNRLRLPSLPLSSWGGQAVTSLDATALLAGLLSAAYLVRILWLKLKSGRSFPPPEVLLSCGCVASISLLTVFFRGGELFSLNRFVFTTPFALVLIDHATTNKISVGLKGYVSLFIMLLAYFMLFGAYVHIQTLMKYAGLSIYLLLFLGIVSQHRTLSWKFWVWLVVAFAVQCYFAMSFLDNGWVA